MIRILALALVFLGDPAAAEVVSCPQSLHRHSLHSAALEEITTGGEAYALIPDDSQSEGRSSLNVWDERQNTGSTFRFTCTYKNTKALISFPISSKHVRCLFKFNSDQKGRVLKGLQALCES